MRRPPVVAAATESDDDPYRARYIAIIADGNGRWASARSTDSRRSRGRCRHAQGTPARSMAALPASGVCYRLRAGG
jgi:undecaprenyl pyrophosphate synthase